MDVSEVNKWYNDAQAALAAGRLKESLQAIKTLTDAAGLYDAQAKANEAETTYNYMLQFFAQGVNDPQRDAVYASVINSLYAICDNAHCTLLTQQSGWQYYSTRRIYTAHGADLNTFYPNYLNTVEKLSLYTEADGNDSFEQEKLTKTKEETLICIFNYIWTSFPTMAPDLAVIRQIFSQELPDDALQVVTISAIYLSLCQYYQDALLSILLETYYKCKSLKVKITALVCSVIVLAKYDNRVSLSQPLTKILTVLYEEDNLAGDVKTIIFLIVRGRDTEQLTKKVHQQIMPEIIKISPNIINKFRDSTSRTGEISQDELLDIESNPEWHKILEDSGITKKIEELTELQMQGSDILHGTFARLKSYPFFEKIANWFLPFDENHSALSNTDNSYINSIIDKSPFLCDSDKYSFCFSLNSMPSSAKQMTASQLEGQNSAIEDMNKSSITNSSKERAAIANSFIQSLYRFVKVYRYHAEHFDPFTKAIDILTLSCLKPIIYHNDTLSLLAEYCLKNEHYTEAISYFSKIKGEGRSADIEQKIGFCYQSLKEYSKAIDAYMRFDLASPNNLWNTRHIAACYRLAGNPDKALDYYRRAEELSPKNVSVALNIGHCLLELGDIEEALKAYFKVDYLDDKRHRAHRPIAWCAMLKGNYDLSRKYYSKIGDTGSTLPHDYLNMGHLAMAEQRFNDAIKLYRLAIEKMDGGINEFRKNFDADLHILIDCGVNKVDICLTLDSLSQ